MNCGTQRIDYRRCQKCGVPNETDHTTPVDFNSSVATANDKLLQRVGHLEQSVCVGASLAFNKCIGVCERSLMVHHTLEWFQSVRVGLNILSKDKNDLQPVTVLP